MSDQKKQLDGANRAQSDKTRGRRTTPAVDTKLKRWGEVPGQGSLFD